MGAELVFAGLVVFATHCVGSLTGFGATVLALPLLALAHPVSIVVPALVAMAWLNSLLIIAMAWRRVDCKLTGRILLRTIPGLPVGFYLFQRLPEHFLCLIIGILVMVIAAFQLARNLRENKAAVSTPRPEMAFDKMLLLGSGTMHGAFGIGGPLLVVYAARTMPGKEQFRLTLSAVWLVLNTLALVAYGFSGMLTPAALKLSAECTPFLLLAALAGELFHQRIGARSFHLVTASLLLISGLALLWR